MLAGDPQVSRVARRKISLLDSHTVNQIAAGEVVERPAAALKELVENALDAGANRIEIRLEEYGRSLISVADNGCGMDEATALLSLQRHATSKILTADDLLSVTSFGFRGEALPSIASVSDLTMESGVGDGLRCSIESRHGKVEVQTPRAGDAGTTIEVRDLFANVPARLKFLKSDATELSAAVDVVSRYAVSRPDVTFIMHHGPSLLVQTTGSSQSATALAEIWGRENASALVPVDYDNGVARVMGYVSPPHFTKPTRSMQWLFANGRPVRTRTLIAAIDQAYRSLTPDRRYPLVHLNIICPPAELDINVSPTKNEVKFHRERGIFDAVRRGIKEALLAHGMVPTLDEIAEVNEAMGQPSQPWLGLGPAPIAYGGSDPYHGKEFGSHRAGFCPNVGYPVGSSDPVADSVGDPQADTSQGGFVPNLSGAGSYRASEFLANLRILGQIDHTFILAENQTNVLIIDQHVAHERILYEMLRDSRGSTQVEVQPLLTPETIEVDRRAFVAIQDQLESLAQVGFQLDPFGGEVFLVRAVPALYRGRKPMELLRDILDEIAEGAGTSLVPSRDEVFIMCSCKMAIKAGDKLGFPEMEKLLTDLAHTENPYLCPHGRPITILLPKSDLYRRFKR